MLSWNYFAYGLTILFFLFQQLGLDYYGQQLSIWFLLLLLPIDLGVFSFFLLNHDVDFAATRGGNCWVVYSWGITVKLVLMYFTSLSKTLQQAGFVIDRIRGGATEVQLFLLIAPILYALLSFRGYDELFGGVTTISTESMLHGDLILHVMLDWWDIVAAFSSFIYFPPMMQADCRWLHLTVGVVICIAVFLHAYSFPTLGDASGQQGKDKGTPEGSGSSGTTGDMAALIRDAGDVFVTRKHAALVGICVVDVPLMVFRIYLWVSYPTFVGFSPFIVKNITSIMMQGMRMWQVISAAKLKLQAVKGREKRRSLMDKHAEDSAFEAVSPDSKKIVKFADDQVDSPHDRLGRPRMSSSIAFGSMPTGGGAPWEIESDRGSDITIFGDPDDERARHDEQQLEELVLKVLATKAPRSLPVDPVRHRQLLRKIIYCTRMGGRHSLGVLLDNVLHISFWKLFRLAFPFMLMWLCQIAIVAVLHFLEPPSRAPSGADALNLTTTKAKLAAFPIQLFDTRVMSGIRISDLPNDVTICLYIIAALLVLSFFLWVFSVPFLDVLATTLFTTIQLFSFFLVVLTFRDFRVFYDIFRLETQFHTPGIGRYFIWLFAIEPAVGVLYTLYPFLCVLLDKQYLGYVVPLPNAATLISKVSNVASTLNVGRGSLPGGRGKGWGGQESGFADNQPKRGDELGLMTISSLIVFLNCRFCVAPISLHELLIGPDLIKSSRLMDGLLYSHFRYFCIASVARLWCFSLYTSFPLSLTYSGDPEYQTYIESNTLIPNITSGYRFNVANIGFLAHLACLFLYLVLTQVVRLLTMRRYETKAMFEEISEIVRQNQGKERDPDEGAGPSPLEVELEWITEKYKVHGFYTTPGDILPNFF